MSNRFYQTEDPFTKAEEQLFEGTLNDKKMKNNRSLYSDTQDAGANMSFSRIQRSENSKRRNTGDQVSAAKSEEKLLASESRSRHQLIGQIFDTYWLVQFEDKFYIIDQHAAHERFIMNVS